MSSELQQALDHAKVVEAAINSEVKELEASGEKTVEEGRPYKKPVTHNLDMKLRDAGFLHPNDSDASHTGRSVQKRGRNRHKRSEGETSIRGGSSVLPHPDSTEGDSTMNENTSNQSVASNAKPAIPPVASGTGEVVGAALTQADSFIDHQVNKFKRESLSAAARDVGKFTAMAAVSVGAFAACCAIGKAMFLKGAPTT
jgi:hypothetical protein